jgi:hypothetical protein
MQAQQNSHAPVQQYSRTGKAQYNFTTRAFHASTAAEAQLVKTT